MDQFFWRTKYKRLTSPRRLGISSLTRGLGEYHLLIAWDSPGKETPEPAEDDKSQRDLPAGEVSLKLVCTTVALLSVCSSVQINVLCF